MPAILSLSKSGEFQTSNGVPFSESQHILRVHDTGPFTTLILPYRKTEAPVRTVTQQACGIQVVQAGESIVMYERWRRLGDASLLDEIGRYNEVDCRSALGCRDWLLTLRPPEATWFVSPAASASKPGNEAKRAEAEDRLGRAVVAHAVLADLENHRSLGQLGAGHDRLGELDADEVE